jgi:copper(I)-binding protein
VRRLLVCCMLLLLTACGAPSQGISIDQAWIRLPVLESQASIAYMQINNHSSSDDYLLAVRSTAYDPIEMHTVTIQDGNMLMRPTDSITIPAKGQTRFESAGDHLMLFPVDSAVLQAGQQVQLTLVFQNAGELTLDLELRRQ